MAEDGWKGRIQTITLERLAARNVAANYLMAEGVVSASEAQDIASYRLGINGEWARKGLSPGM